MPEWSDWWIVSSIVVAWILGANAVLMAQNLRSRRKCQWQAGWDAAAAHFPPPWKIEQQSWVAGWDAAIRKAKQQHPPLPPSSPPSSRATETTAAIPPGERGS